MDVYEISRHHIMPGAVFIVCVPSEEHERELQAEEQKSKLSPKESDSPSEQFLRKSPAHDVKTPLLHRTPNRDYASFVHSSGQKNCSCLYMQNVTFFFCFLWIG